MPNEGEIRQTIRVSEARHPDEFAYLHSLKTDEQSWADVLRTVVSKAMLYDMGDPQFARIEKGLNELKELIASQPHTAVKVLDQLPPEEKTTPAVNPFGEGFETW